MLRNFVMPCPGHENQCERDKIGLGDIESEESVFTAPEYGFQLQLVTVKILTTASPVMAAV
jgi:hypothetical protein